MTYYYNTVLEWLRSYPLMRRVSVTVRVGVRAARHSPVPLCVLLLAGGDSVHQAQTNLTVRVPLCITSTAGEKDHILTTENNSLLVQ